MLQNLLGGISGISNLRMLGYAGLLIGGLVTYHFLDEAKDAAQLAVSQKETATAKLEGQTTKTELATTQGQLLSQEQKQQADKNTIAYLRKEVTKWKTAYETDMATCKTLLAQQQGEIDRRKLVEEKLKAYAEQNPEAKKKMPQDYLRILNGE